MFRRELFLRHGGFDVELERLEDWDLWTRYFAAGSAEFVPATTSFFRIPASAAERWRRKAVLEALAGAGTGEAAGGTGGQGHRPHQAICRGDRAFRPAAGAASLRPPPLDRRLAPFPGAGAGGREACKISAAGRAAVARRIGVGSGLGISGRDSRVP